MKYPIAERFVSINGEGRLVGELAVFLRFPGCNLGCSYCDTGWVNEKDCKTEGLTLEEILSYVDEMGIQNITVTGGEPLIQEGMGELLEALCGLAGRHVEVETNGSISLKPFLRIARNLSFTMDYKLPGSGMEEEMCMANLGRLREGDVLKFVCGTGEDLERALELLNLYRLMDRISVYFSPVFGKLSPVEIVEFLKEKRLNGVRLQLQLHKYIWTPKQRGV